MPSGIRMQMFERFEICLSSLIGLKALKVKIFWCRYFVPGFYCLVISFDAGRNSFNLIKRRPPFSGQDVNVIANNCEAAMWPVFFTLTWILLTSWCCLILDLALQTVVFCLVEIHIILGNSFDPYLGSLSSTQRRLVTIYSNRISQVVHDFQIVVFQ